MDDHQYAEDWQVEDDDMVCCPECGGKIEYRDAVTSDGLTTHYRCVDCRIQWSTDGDF